MAHRNLDDSYDPFYTLQSTQPDDDPPISFPTPSYAFPPAQDLLPASNAFMMASQPAPSMFNYDPISLGMENSGNFGYHPTTYPPTNVSLQHMSQHTALDAAFPTLPTTQPSSIYWGMSTAGAGAGGDAPQRTQQPSSTQRPGVPSQQPRDAPAPTRKPQQEDAPAYAPRLLQPKGPGHVSGAIPSRPKPGDKGADTEFTSIYSNSGFDIMRVLAEVVSRPNPKINIGAVDLSCAFVLCDITQEDHPIVYVSEPFERLTGYTEDEIVGQNCRFLQGPDGVIRQGMHRTFVDAHTAFRLRSTIEDRTEIQASIINYRKGGQPFMNLITMIPIRWNSPDYRFYVGFQVDLVEKPDAVTRRNPNGTYMINYQRSQLPRYVVPSPEEIYRMRPDLAPQYNPAEVSMILENLRCPNPSYRTYLDRVLADNTDDVIHVLSFEGEFLYLSPSCRATLEYDSTELVGKTLSTVCHPSDIGPVIRDLRANTSTEPLSVLYRIRRKHSGYIWFESRGAWHISQDRGRQYLVMVGRPRRVYCLDQLAKLGGLAETDLWAKISLSGIVLFMSSKVRPVLGRVPDDLIGKGFTDLVDSRADAQKALEQARTGSETTFTHRIRHKKGHMVPVRTTFFPGDTREGVKPTFLVAQLCFPRSPQTTPTTEEPSSDSSGTVVGTMDLRVNLSSRLPSGNEYVATIREPPTLFTELGPTRGSSWQLELRELERQNRGLADELQRMLTRRKKRKRKQSTALVTKVCAMCQTRKTPEWRRGPSGNRDLCNSCGLRWAKQVRQRS